MKIKKILLSVLMIAVLGPGSVPLIHASCFDSASLGEYKFREWSDANGTWAISEKVGSYSDVFFSRSALSANKVAMTQQCTLTGNLIMNKVEAKLQEQKQAAVAEWNATCPDTSFFCSPAVRDVSISIRHHEIDTEIGRMRSLYKLYIEKCKDQFENAFDLLGPRMCQ